MCQRWDLGAKLHYSELSPLCLRTPLKIKMYYIENLENISPALIHKPHCFSHYRSTEVKYKNPINWTCFSKKDM